jgi:hypothetical protein
MQSLASLMSVNNNDIAPLGDFDDDDEDAEGEYCCVVINLVWFLPFILVMKSNAQT